MIDDPRSLTAQLIAASPLAMPLDDALKQKRERCAALLAAPPLAEPNTAPEPFPVIDSPDKYAADFWKKRPNLLGDPPPPPKPQTSKSRSRKPVGSVPPSAQRFRVIDGDKGG